jgi:hypothetical protein
LEFARRTREDEREKRPSQEGSDDVFGMDR